MTTREFVPSKFRPAALRLAAETLWHLPGCFGIARVLGPSYSLRCVVFHDISVTESPFTKGMGVSITPVQLEAELKFLTTYYTPVSLQDVLAASDGRGLPPRAILVTFDDGYASVLESAVPLCRKLGLPAIFFVNAAFLDNERLAPDNLVCYAANVLGMETINDAARAVKGSHIPKLRSLTEVFTSFFPSITLLEREAFLDALIDLGEIGDLLAGEAGLYLTRKQLRWLASLEFEIGNHTYTHANCRSLTPEDFEREIGRNKTELGILTGRQVRSFSVPYGSSADLTADVKKHLQLSGHEAVFLSESVANSRTGDKFHLDRVSARAESDDGFFFEIEVLPRLRAIRNRLSRGSAFVQTSREPHGFPAAK